MKKCMSLLLTVSLFLAIVVATSCNSEPDAEDLPLIEMSSSQVIRTVGACTGYWQYFTFAKEGLSGLTIVDLGFCVSESTEPTLNDFYFSVGLEPQFNVVRLCDLGISGPGSYYICAYATNANGTSYSNTQHISLTEEDFLPYIWLHYTISNVNYVNDELLFNLFSGASCVVNDCGWCWSTSASPTINGNHISIGSYTCPSTFNGGVSMQRCDITQLGLQSGQTYYFRAYAITDSGITYSDEFQATYNYYTED